MKAQDGSELARRYCKMCGTFLGYISELAWLALGEICEQCAEDE